MTTREIDARRRAAWRMVGRSGSALVVGRDALAALPYVAGRGDWDDRDPITRHFKGVISAMATGDLPERTPVEVAFLQAMAEDLIPAQLGMPGMPLFTRVVVNSSPAVGAEVEPGGAIPAIAGNLSDAVLRPRRFGAITPVTRESAVSPVAGIAEKVGADLTGATAAPLNDAFVSPSRVGSILFGAPNFSGSGSSAAALADDFRTASELVGGSGKGCAILTHPATAMYLGLVLGIPGLGPDGGRLGGLPVYCSEACDVGASPTTRLIALVNPRRILWGAESRVELDVSSTAALKLDDAADGSPSGLTSLYQSDTTAVRAIVSAAWYAAPQCSAFFTVSF